MIFCKDDSEVQAPSRLVPMVTVAEGRVGLEDHARELYGQAKKFHVPPPSTSVN